MNIKIFFTWWKRQTFGTFLKTLFFGKYIGSDEQGNKYYQSKKNERWIIYNDDIEATKITSDWYLWMHHTTDQIPNNKSNRSNDKRIKLLTKCIPKSLIFKGEIHEFFIKTFKLFL